MRRRGEGTVERRGDRWRFRSVDGSGGRFTSRAVYTTEAEARAALAMFARKVAAGELVPVAGLTLADYYEHHFLPRLERLVERGVRRQGTLGFYASHWPRLERLAHVPLRALDVPTISRWVDGLADKVERPEAYLAVLRAILQSAVSVDFVLDANPARGVRVEVSRDDDEAADRAPTPEEAAALMSCPQIPEADRLIIAFALGAGLRPGEWRTLRLADVHLDDEVPHVLVRYGTPGGPTKTGKKRRVPLLSLAQQAMRRWLEVLPTYCPKNPLGLAFPTPRGKTRTNEPFGRRKEGSRQVNRWHEFLRVAGVKRRLTPHGLRHGCATGLLTGALGDRLEPWAVQLLLGHERPSTTERYLHHRERDLFRAVSGTETQSPNSPLTKTPDRETPVFHGVFASGDKGMPTGGLDLAILPREARIRHSQGKNGLSGTEAGTDLFDWQQTWERLASGEWPTEAAALAMAAQAEAERTERDPVLRAVRRIRSTRAWRMALVDLLNLMVGFDAASRSGSGR
jgi:integrase